MYPKSHYYKSISPVHHFEGFPRIVFVLLLLTTYYLLPTALYAASDFTVTPAIIDGKGKQREILRFTSVVTNTTQHLVSIYPWVTDVDAALGETGTSDLGGSQGKDLGESPSRWIEVTRGVVDLLPGEHREIPIMVQIHLNAKPGVYHAVIHLSEGSNRASAEANKVETEEVLVNIEVLEDINERLELNSFAPEKKFFSSNSASFNYRVANIGNRGLVPHGKIRIYDGHGEEVATVDANDAGKRLEPSVKEMIGSVWMAGDHFGRYKAMLDLQYGSRGTLQDTVFFWVIPWKKALGMFLTLMIFCVIAALGMHSYTASQRGGAFAPAVVGGGRLRGMLSRFRSEDEEDGEDEDDESDPLPSEVRKGMISELREVEIPHPTHTRLHERSAPQLFSETRLQKSISATPRPEHQVYLVKREHTQAKPNPDHVVNLKK